jgi:hypothetical protein
MPGFCILDPILSRESHPGKSDLKTRAECIRTEVGSLVNLQSMEYIANIVLNLVEHH